LRAFRKRKSGIGVKMIARSVAPGGELQRLIFDPK
jgi:hypothetical protein